MEHRKGSNTGCELSRLPWSSQQDIKINISHASIAKLMQVLRFSSLFVSFLTPMICLYLL